MREAIMYAFFERVEVKPNGEPYKHPKYTAKIEWGKYPPLDALRGRDGVVSLYLLPSVESGSKDSTSTPPMRLQAKGSLNLTGLKNYYVGGELSGYAFGNPYNKPTYGKSDKINPFGEDCKDGFLFRFKFVDGSHTPTSFEMIVIPNVGNLIANHCEMFRIGGYDKFVEEVRKQATDNPLSLI